MRHLVHPHGLLVLGRRAEGAGTLHDPVEQLRCFGIDLHPADRRIGFVLTDLQLLDREVATQVHDQVHHLRQHHRVDDVALEDQACGMPSLAQRRTPITALICAFRAAVSRAGLVA